MNAVLSRVLNNGSRQGGNRKNFIGGNRVSRAFHNIANSGRKIGHVANSISNVASTINNSGFGGALSNIPGFKAGIDALKVVGRMSDGFKKASSLTNAVVETRPKTEGYV